MKCILVKTHWIIQLLVIAIFSSPISSTAMTTSLFPAVLEQRYLENEKSDLYFQRINSFSGNLTFEFYQLGIESQSWSIESGTALINYKEDFQEINTTHLFRMGSTLNWLFFYSGIGIGSYESELTSEFSGAITKTNSGQTMMASGIISVQAIYWHIHVITELKLILGKDFRPQPTPDLSVKLGVVF